MISLNQNALYQRCKTNLKPQLLPTGQYQYPNFACSLQSLQGYLLGLVSTHTDPLSRESIATFVRCLNLNHYLRAKELEVYTMLSHALEHDLYTEHHTMLFLSNAQDEPHVQNRLTEISNFAYGLLNGMQYAELVHPQEEEDASATYTVANYNRDKRTLRRIMDIYPSSNLTHVALDNEVANIESLVKRYCAGMHQEAQAQKAQAQAQAHAQAQAAAQSPDTAADQTKAAATNSELAMQSMHVARHVRHHRSFPLGTCAHVLYKNMRHLRTSNHLLRRTGSGAGHALA